MTLRLSVRRLLLAALALAVAPGARVTPPLLAQAVGGAAPDAPAELPCTAVRSILHGVILIGARVRMAGGPDCDVMQLYAQWLEASDTLDTAPPEREARFTGREWDYASGAMRLGAPRHFVLIRGDSLTVAAPGRPARLHLTAFAAGTDERPRELGSWFVLTDADSTSSRLFRSPVTARRLHAVLEQDGSLVYVLGGVQVDGAHVRAQLTAARALRRALGFAEPMPRARFVVGPSGDSSLAMLGVVRMAHPLFAMTVSPPLAVFAPLTPTRGLDSHELVHVATMGRRGVVPASVGEAFALHHGGSHERPFAESVCASMMLRGLPPLDAVQLDSALAGRWWDDARSDVAGFALGHAIGWFIAQRGDSAWIFAEGEPAKDNDAIGFLAARAGMAREVAMALVVETLAARRAACPAASPAASPSASPAASPPSGAAAAPAPVSP